MKFGGHSNREKVIWQIKNQMERLSNNTADDFILHHLNKMAENCL